MVTLFRRKNSVKKLNNKGFTLVELIIVMAIMGLVGLAVAGFIGTSSSQYKSATKEVDLQYEAQIFMNQLGDMVQSATKVTSCTYSATAGDVVEVFEVTKTIEKEDPKASGNTITETHVYKLTLNLDKSKVYMQKDSGSKDLMAEYVSGFKATIDKDKNSVNFDVDFKNDNKTYNVTQNFTMRNKM